MWHNKLIVWLALAMATATVASPAMAIGNRSNDCPSCGASNASLMLPQASGLVLVGSLSIAGASGMLIVESIEAIGDGVVVVFKGASQAATCSVKLGTMAMRNSTLMAGSAVSVVALSTGTMLVVSGQALAFVPNALGQSLLYQSKVR